MDRSLVMGAAATRRWEAETFDLLPTINAEPNAVCPLRAKLRRSECNCDGPVRVRKVDPYARRTATSSSTRARTVRHERPVRVHPGTAYSLIRPGGLSTIL